MVIKKRRTYELPEISIEIVKKIAKETGDSQNVVVETAIDYYNKNKYSKDKRILNFKPCPVKYGQEV